MRVPPRFTKPVTLKTRLRVRFVLLSLAALVVLQTMIIAFSAAGNYQRMTINADRLIMQIGPTADSRRVRDGEFFRVSVDTETNTINALLPRTSPVSEDEAEQYGRQVTELGVDKGYVGQYRYLVRREANTTIITFLSRQEAIAAFQGTTQTMIVMSLAAIAAMTTLLAAVSGVVVAPVVNNRRRQQEFITSASHELKTPLTVISADAQLLESEIGQNEWLTDIMKQTNDMADMTRRLVYLTRAEEQARQPVHIEFPISDLAQDVAEPYHALALNSGKSYTTAIRPGLSYCGDEKAIRELMSALIDNAFKYCTENGAVSVSLDGDSKGALFTVSNTVSDIDPEQLELFSQRFYRATRSCDIAGFGIGLSLAQAVAQAHGGSLTIALPQKHMIVIRAKLGSSGNRAVRTQHH